jgi:Fe-S cluster assembly iron-binding protein IscA
MLQLDKKTVSEFENAWVEKLKVFFIEAGCSGTKIQMETEFEVTGDLEFLYTITSSQPSPLGEKGQAANVASLSSKGEGIQGWGGIQVYIPKSDKKYLENAKITRVVKADHTWVEKTRYIFASDDVEDRCGCGTSFAFEKPVPKIDLEKLKKLRENFNNKK